MQADILSVGPDATVEADLHRAYLDVSSSLSETLVPEARLELAHLAAEDFESSASTIPPLGPASGV